MEDTTKLFLLFGSTAWRGGGGWMTGWHVINLSLSERFHFLLPLVHTLSGEPLSPAFRIFPIPDPAVLPKHRRRLTSVPYSHASGVHVRVCVRVCDPIENTRLAPTAMLFSFL